MDFRHLFPYEKVKGKSKILIYGCTVLGQDYLRQMMITQYCKVIGFVDRRADKYSEMIVPVYFPYEIAQIKYDYIIIAMQRPDQMETILNDLFIAGVSKKEIVYEGVRSNKEIRVYKQKSIGEIKREYAYQLTGISIGIKFNAALGDNVVRKKIVEALIKLEPNCIIDLYSPAADNVLKHLYYGCTNISQFIDDAGGLYQQQKNSYDVAVRIERMFPCIDQLQLDHMGKNLLFVNKMKQWQKYCKNLAKEYVDNTYLNVMRALINGKNYYTLYDADGILGICDSKVKIILNPKYFNAYKQLHLQRYITIGYGAGAAMMSNSHVNKQWPLSSFEKFIELFKEEYPGVEVVQLSAKGAPFMKSADHYLMGEPLGVVEYVLENAICHVDIESGLVHLASQLDTKCVVLIGPSQVKFWGYQTNIHVSAGACGDCSGMYSSDVKCARSLDKPECMYKIMPYMLIDAFRNNAILS